MAYPNFQQVSVLWNRLCGRLQPEIHDAKEIDADDVLRSDLINAAISLVIAQPGQQSSFLGRAAAVNVPGQSQLRATCGKAFRAW